MYAIRSYYDLGTRVPASSTLTAMTAFDLSAYNGTQVKIKFTVAGTASGVGAGIDDINISGVISSSPVLNVTPATLAGMTYVFGNGPSTSQSFDLSGSNLSGAPGDITIT